MSGDRGKRMRFGAYSVDEDAAYDVAAVEERPLNADHHREVGYPAMVRYGRLGNLTKWRP